MKIVRPTPPPWQIAAWARPHASDGFVTVITDSRGHGLFESLQYGSSDKVEANAVLIISAHDLLTALQGLVDNANPTAADWARARRAIARATRKIGGRSR